MALPGFVVEDIVVHENGQGDAIELPGGAGLIEFTLGILEVVEQESLDVLLFGSPDGVNWPAKPMTAFPQKFYAGTSKILFDPSQYPDARFVRAQWKVNRWGHWKGFPPSFRFYVFAAVAA